MNKIFKIGLVSIAIFVAIIAILVAVINVANNNKKFFSYPSEFHYIYLDGGRYKAAADELAKQVQNRSGAGIVQASNMFEVLCFMYENTSDAEKVKDSLKKQGLEAMVGVIKMEQLNLKVKRKMRDDRDFRQLLQCFPKNFYIIYDLVCDYDKGAIAESAVYVRMRQMYMDLLDKGVRSRDGLSGVLLQYISRFKVAMEEFVCGKQDEPTSAVLKQLCFYNIMWYNEAVLTINSMHV